MVIVQSRPKRKKSGGRYTSYRGKRIYELGSRPTLTKIGAQKGKVIRTRGGNQKYRLQDANIVNVYDPKTKKYVKATIKTVVENPANRHYVRRNILTKGTVIETDKGKARITNRPGQEHTIHAVILSEK